MHVTQDCVQMTCLAAQQQMPCKCLCCEIQPRQSTFEDNNGASYTSSSTPVLSLELSLVGSDVIRECEVLIGATASAAGQPVGLMR